MDVASNSASPVGTCEMSGYRGSRSRRRTLWFSSEEYDLGDGNEAVEQVEVQLRAYESHLSGDETASDQHCAVCDDAATGFHYKCMTCEGCKGFFRRTVQRKLADKYVCRTSRQNCVISRENRGRCQACRYAKCLAKGMVQDLVLSTEERLAKKLLITGNRKRRQNGMFANPSSASNNGNNTGDNDEDDDIGCSTPDGSIESIRVTYQSETYKTAISKAYFECYLADGSFDVTSPWTVTNFLDPTLKSTHPFVQATALHLTRTANFIEMIPHLKDLALSDKLLLLGNCGLKILLFQVARKLFVESPSTVIAESNDEAVRFVYRSLRFLKVYVSRQNFDVTETALFAALLVCQSGECHELRDPQLVEYSGMKLESSIIEHSLLIRGIERHKDDFILGNCSLARCVPTLFDSMHLFNLEDGSPEATDLLRHFK